METTPPRSKLSCRSARVKADVRIQSSSFESDRVNSKIDQETEYSPLYFPTTQESNEDIDVLWDWHSPQTSERRRKKQKRLIPVQSPNVPIKRHPSINKITNFDKLRDELRLLQEELAVPDDESCLCVSPQQEIEFKNNNDEINSLSVKEPEQFDNFDDFFNDSVDEQLVLFSQQIENELLKKENVKHVDTKKAESIFDCDNAEIDDLINKYSKRGCDKFDNRTNKENHNSVSSSYQNSTVKTNTSTNNNKFSFQRTYSDDQNLKTKNNVIQTLSGKLELHRTKSFELEAKTHMQVNIPKSKLEEIERKRLEAMAKLALKKKGEINKNNTTHLSPSKCSPEEIEKKRLQALAKREAKRLEEIVERKRQEALKKLQANRMKNANLVKSTLTTRL